MDPDALAAKLAAMEQRFTKQYDALSSRLDNFTIQGA